MEIERKQKVVHLTEIDRRTLCCALGLLRDTVKLSSDNDPMSAIVFVSISHLVDLFDLDKMMEQMDDFVNVLSQEGE